MNTLLNHLSTAEKDKDQLDSIARLESAFSEVKQRYSQEYSEHMKEAVTQVKNRMKQNSGMSSAVNAYVNKYAENYKKESAKEELYDMLSAELLETLQTLQHTNCSIC